MSHVVAGFLFISCGRAAGRQLTTSLTRRHLIHASTALGPVATTVLNITTTTNNTSTAGFNSSPPSDIGRTSNKAAGKCSSETTAADDGQAIVDDDLEDMFHDGPCGVEWNGPTRGGRRPEPTRYGDWERKGRVSDF
jgi:hypothetical protein